MLCDDVQRELATRGAGATSLPEDVAAHVSICAACSQAERVFARIDSALHAPLWQPPRGFARTITAHALQEAAPDGRAAVPRAGLWLHHLTVWGLVGTAVYLAVHAASVLGPAVREAVENLLSDPVTAAAISAGISAVSSMWIVYRLRIHRAG